MSEHVDTPAEVRRGQELDLESLRAFLSQQLGAAPKDLEVRQFPAGHSNLTYLVEADDEEWVLRRPPAGTRPSSGHDMGREFRILEGLKRVVDWVPRPVVLCEDEAVLGAPFYLMERVRGVILRGSDGGVGELSEEKWRQLSALCVETLVEIHEVDVEAAGLADLGRPVGYVDRQVDGWIRRWRRARTEEVETIEEVTRWLDDHRPDDDLAQAGLVHNDFKYDNLVIDPDSLDEVRAVLDWELATLGDRRMDLGTTLAYWTEPGDDPALLALGLGPTVESGNFTRRQVAAHYRRKSEATWEDVLYFYVFGLFKVAVIGQQIFYRYHQGQTTDERFAGLIHAVKGLGRQAIAALEAGEI